MEPERGCSSRDRTAFKASGDRGQGRRRISYTGLTSAFIDGKPYLYVANFTKGVWMFMTVHFIL